MNNLVLVFAHPDDAEISSYGTIRKFLEDGFKVDLVILTNGITGISVKDQEKTEVLSFADEVRQLETKKAFDGLDINIHFLNFTTSNLLFESNAITKIEKCLKQLTPSILVTHYNDSTGFDHQEHTITSKIVLNISVRLPNVKQILLAEPIQSGKISFHPNFFVNITKYFEDKCRSLVAHKTQAGRYYLEESFHSNRSKRNALVVGILEDKFESFSIIKWVY